MVTIVVAVARGGAIGRGNALLFRIREDLQHFKALTLGHRLVMGRRTYESIGRPLPGRTTVVLTRDAAFGASLPGGVERCGDLEAALRHGTGEELFVVGGAEVYAQALPWADRVVLTRIDADAAGADAFFPSLSADVWVRVWAGDWRADAAGTRYRFEEYRKR